MIPAISEYWIPAATVPAVSGAQVCGFILVVITERTKCGITRCNMHDFGSPACKPTIVGSLWSQERFGPVRCLERGGRHTSDVTGINTIGLTIRAADVIAVVPLTDSGSIGWRAKS
jgi:hypothetical protein